MEIISKHIPFKAAGQQFTNSNPIFAYYFFKYYVTTIKPIYQDTKQPQQKSQIQSEIKQTINFMNSLGYQSKVGNQQQNLKNMLDYTQLMFAKNDHLHRQQGQYSKQIAQDYLVISRLYEVVSKFYNITQDQKKRKIYSKKKFIDIMKELKKNPQLQNSKGGPMKQSINQPQQPVTPAPPVFKQQKSIQKIEQMIKKSNFKPLPKPSKLISFDKVQMQLQATKNIENALSQLSFDRFKYARDELIHALQLLDQLIDG